MLLGQGVVDFGYIGGIEFEKNLSGGNRGSSILKAGVSRKQGPPGFDRHGPDRDPLIRPSEYRRRIILL